MGIKGSLRYRIGSKLPLSAYRYLYRYNVVGVFYHVITDQILPHIQHLYPYKTEAAFIRDLEFLRKNYHLISYWELLESLSGTGLASGSLLISFDDGYRECFTIVRPLLLEMDIPCIFFIPTDFVDNESVFYRNKVSWCIDAANSLSEPHFEQFCLDVQKTSGRDIRKRDGFIRWIKQLPYSEEALVDEIAQQLNLDWEILINVYRPFMSSDEIRHLANNGFVIGAHSCRHVRFNELNASQIEEEILLSCQKIRELTGQNQVPFSFPFSGEGVDVQMISNLRAREDYLGLFFDSRGLISDQSYIIDRVWADPPEGSSLSKTNLDMLLLQSYKENFLGR